MYKNCHFFSFLIFLLFTFHFAECQRRRRKVGLWGEEMWRRIQDSTHFLAGSSLMTGKIYTFADMKCPPTLECYLLWVDSVGWDSTHFLVWWRLKTGGIYLLLWWPLKWQHWIRLHLLHSSDLEWLVWLCEKAKVVFVVNTCDGTEQKNKHTKISVLNVFRQQ